MKIKRGDIYYSNLSPGQGSEQRGIRPVVIIQNDFGNQHSNTTIIVPITSRYFKTKLPTHVKILNSKLIPHSMAMAEQIRTIDKSRLTDYIGHIDAQTMDELENAIDISLGLKNGGQK